MPVVSDELRIALCVKMRRSCTVRVDVRLSGPRPRRSRGKKVETFESMVEPEACLGMRMEVFSSRRPERDIDDSSGNVLQQSTTPSSQRSVATIEPKLETGFK